MSIHLYIIYQKSTFSSTTYQPCCRQPMDVELLHVSPMVLFLIHGMTALQLFCLNAAHLIQARILWNTDADVTVSSLSHYLFVYMCAAQCVGVCLCEYISNTSPQMCVFLQCLPSEQAAKSSAAPQSLRTSCSSLLAARKSNQSTAFSPELTSAFNYRTQQWE